LGRLVGRCPKRGCPPFPVPSGVNHDRNTVPVSAGRKPVREMLDGVDRLAMVTDEQAEIVADVFGTEPVLFLMNRHRGLDAGCLGDSLHQLSYPLSGCLAAG
jgi:hypothetical protein